MREVGPDQRLADEVRAAYEGSAEAWANGPASIYRGMAAALLATTPRPLAGRLVLDLGAGTGVASDALTEAGAHPVGVDLAHAMLAHRRARRPPGVVADALALPFAEATFDAVVAAFCLNHVPDPATALAECRRVTRPGSPVLASTFPNDVEHPAKPVVEAVLERFGYRRPDWYRTFKDHIAALTGEAEAFAGAAVAAGLADPRVERVEVDVGLDDPERAVEWRLNMPHTLGFVAGLEAGARRRLRAEAVAALSSRLPSSVVMLALRARAP
ncbi:class I SAM-dependent methyltransferase [Egibacter rhizosphaerae]|uniref:Class I SAM-dependent methyltransferase n=1 Tax=Egibacter rhizosphaerae TaxID=1670831 RepID=A0A411YAI2_9ACTN|nr:class I SAM-dependent methyltransferase [Egibacter rhizosphaerae]QBI18187.1 class I SAM-dependent methyltransferase [Egibacter rhizosphaerae]